MKGSSHETISRSISRGSNRACAGSCWRCMHTSAISRHVTVLLTVLGVLKTYVASHLKLIDSYVTWRAAFSEYCVCCEDTSAGLISRLVPLWTQHKYKLAVVNTIKKRRVPHLTSWATVSFSRETLIHEVDWQRSNVDLLLYIYVERRSKTVRKRH